MKKLKLVVYKNYTFGGDTYIITNLDNNMCVVHEPTKSRPKARKGSFTK